MKHLSRSGHIEYSDESGFEEGIESAVTHGMKLHVVRVSVCLFVAIMFVIGASYAIASNSQMFY